MGTGDWPNPPPQHTQTYNHIYKTSTEVHAGLLSAPTPNTHTYFLGVVICVLKLNKVKQDHQKPHRKSAAASSTKCVTLQDDRGIYDGREEMLIVLQFARLNQN